VGAGALGQQAAANTAAAMAAMISLAYFIIVSVVGGLVVVLKSGAPIPWARRAGKSRRGTRLSSQLWHFAVILQFSGKFRDP
jgi:hypothetical protein